MRSIYVNTMLAFPLLVALSFFSTHTLQSQWIRKNLPVGGPTNAIAFKDSFVFAGCDSGVFRSVNGGDTWLPKSSGIPSDRRVRSLVTRFEKLYAGTDNGLYRSANNGDSWSKVAGLAPNFTIKGLVSGSRLWAGGHVSGFAGPWLYWSSNIDTVWTRVTTGSGLAGDSLTAIVLDDTAYFAGISQSNESKIFRSTDGGDHWVEKRQGIPSSLGGHVSSIVTYHGMVCVSINSRTYRSTDKGETWQQPSAGLFSSSHLSFYRRGQYVYLLCASAISGVSISADSGWTWNAVSSGLPVGSFDPRCLANNGEIIMLGTDNGLYRRPLSDLNVPTSVLATGNSTPQQTTVNTSFAIPLQTRVTDRSGNPVSGVTVTFTAPTGGSSGAFAGGVYTAITNASGVATAPLFTANLIAGSYAVNATVSGVAAPAVFSLTNLPGAAAIVTETGGTPQSAEVHRGSFTRLEATVSDQYGNPVPSINVLFAAPPVGSGASADFGGSGRTKSDDTDTDGIARTNSLSPNDTAGSYVVTATIAGVPDTGKFYLTNNPARANDVTAVDGMAQSAQVHTPFAVRLKVRVTDQYGNVVPDSNVAFTAPTFGATGTFTAGSATAIVTTGSNGLATAPVFTANGTVGGPYSVTARVQGAGTANFSMTNTAGSATLTTLAADAITFTGATLHGQVVASGVTGTAYFEYGQDASLAGATSTPAQSVGSGTAALQAAVAGLQPHTVYYFRLNSSLTTTPGTTLNFTTRNNVVPVSGTVPFSATVSQSTEYRLVSVPGNAGTTVSTFIQGAGEQTYDWRAWREPGNGGFNELSANSQINIGEGIWLLRKNAFTFASQAVTMPALQSDGTTPITIHEGWNIIANPFDRGVDVSSLRQANNSFSQMVWEYDSKFDTAFTLEPFKGYYLHKENIAGSSLKIPYPFSSTSPIIPQSPAQRSVEWQLRLKLATSINSDEENHIGIASTALPGRDGFEYHKPPLVFDQGFLYFSRPGWDQSYPYFNSDYRPAIGEGQVWDFEVRNPRLSRTAVSWEGVENIPSEYKVVLYRTSSVAPIDMRVTSEFVFTPTSAKTSFKLVVGPSKFVEEQIRLNRPTSYKLEQNYPNPFNPRTSINYQVPIASFVTLKVYNTLGQEVAILVRGFEDAGYKSVEFNAAGFASGVYIYSLQAGEFTAVKKMTVIK